MTPTAHSAWPRSVAIVGAAGLIGAGVAHQLALSGLSRDIYLLDVHANLVRAHAIDMAEAQLVAGQTAAALHPVTAAADVPAVDLVIVAASAPETPEGDRRHFLANNLALLRTLAPEITRMAGTTGCVLLLSNPVDILCGILQRLTALAPQRIIGYSLNDSIRLRMALGRELGVMPDRLDAVVLGEHGAGQVPIFSRLTLDGQPLTLSPEAEARVRADADGWFARWSALKPGRSSGWTTPLGTLANIRAMVQGEVFPCSVSTFDQPGLNDAFITLPARLGPEGRRAIERWTLDEREQQGLRRAADAVASAIESALAVQ